MMNRHGGEPRRYSVDPEDRKPGKVITYTLTPEELAQYGPPGKPDEKGIAGAKLTKMLQEEPRNKQKGRNRA